MFIERMEIVSVGFGGERVGDSGKDMWPSCWGDYCREDWREVLYLGRALFHRYSRICCASMRGGGLPRFGE